MQSLKALRDAAEFAQHKFVTLKPRVKTRWWGDVIMLETLQATKAAMAAHEIGDKSTVPGDVATLDWDLIETVLEVLRPFAAAIECMEGEQYVSISSVLGVVCLLQKDLNKLTQHENGTIRGAAECMLTDFNQRCAYR